MHQRLGDCSRLLRRISVMRYAFAIFVLCSFVGGAQSREQHLRFDFTTVPLVLDGNRLTMTWDGPASSSITIGVSPGSGDPQAKLSLTDFEDAMKPGCLAPGCKPRQIRAFPRESVEVGQGHINIRSGTIGTPIIYLELPSKSRVTIASRDRVVFEGLVDFGVIIRNGMVSRADRVLLPTLWLERVMPTGLGAGSEAPGEISSQALASRITTFASAIAPLSEVGSNDLFIVELGVDGRLRILDSVFKKATLRPAAEEAVEKWRATPFWLGGKAVPVRCKVPAHVEPDGRLMFSVDPASEVR